MCKTFSILTQGAALCCRCIDKPSADESAMKMHGVKGGREEGTESCRDRRVRCGEAQGPAPVLGFLLDSVSIRHIGETVVHSAER